ncbi:MAG: dihydropteroate synthase [Paramuribaculum sp.]|nr:dihydropteroate synthase [Paramuribaculum sp.]
MNRISTNPLIGFKPKFKSFTLNLGGQIFHADRPLVMGILNFTPDSFYAASRVSTESEIRDRIYCLLNEGADIIDIGGQSTRPGADIVNPDEERRRLEIVLNVTGKMTEDLIISVDTFRGEIARFAVEKGASIVNDVSGGMVDSTMYQTVAELGVPYVITHCGYDTNNEVSESSYDAEGGVTAAVIKLLAFNITEAKAAGIKDLIADPGFGFAKTVTQNYTLLRDLPVIAEAIESPLLVGMSRKSMLYKPLGINSNEALTPTVTADTIALLTGASIVRVHDVLAARQTIEIIKRTYNPF